MAAFLAFVVACTVWLTPQRALAFASLDAPQRLADSRVSGVTIDGLFAGDGARAADSTWAVAVGGRAGLPFVPGAAVLNVTAEGAISSGFVTVFPCDQPRPNASNLNFVAGRTSAVLAVSRTDAAGHVCLYTSGATNLIVDASSWLDAGDFTALAAPQRIADSRPTGTTTDGQAVGSGAKADGTVQHIQVTGRAGVPTGVSSVLLSLTADGALEPGFLTVHPCDAATPTASNINYGVGDTVANAVAARLDGNGQVCIFNHGATNLIVDVVGWFPAGRFTPLSTPTRVLDTRSPRSTADGMFDGKGRRPDQSTLQLHVGGRVGVPTTASAVVLNITVAAAEPGFVTVHPRGTDRPVASNINYGGGQIVANAAVARLGASGDICVFTEGSAHVIIDVVGYLSGPPPASAGPECPGQHIFPTWTLVALYGNGSSAALGALGEQSPDEAAKRLATVAAPWKGYGRPVLGTFELIVTTAQASAGPSGLYRGRASEEEVQRYLDVARANGLYLVLDIQPGRSDFLTETKVWERFLREPDVGLALDPEWRVGPNSVPAVVVGSVGAAEVNAVSDYVAKIVADNNLPEKLFVVHQFQQRMLPDRNQIVSRPGLATMFHMDGFGSRAEKLSTWGFTQTGPPFHNGFKLFYDEDSNIFGPTEVMALTPRVELITYQ